MGVGGLSTQKIYSWLRIASKNMGTRVGFLVVLFTFFSPGKAEFHFTDDDWRSYVKGPEDVSDYDIIEPGVVHHERTKRGSDLQFASSVNFTAFGDHFHIDLLQSELFFDPDLKVKVYREDGSFEEQPLTVSPDCFYHGFLPTHNFSTATVSICDGKLHGYIDDGVHGIFITPLIEKHSNEYSRRRRTPHSGHLIYKRTTPEEGERFCPVGREGFDAGNSPQTSEQLFVPPKYLEVAVLLDVTFQADRQPDPAGYAMALMHVASRRFAEPTLDVTLQIIIVELIFLPSDSGMVRGSQLDIVADGLTTLNSLILWNQGASGTDGTPGHWDNVVLISGKDLTSTTSGSDLLGIASTIGTCVSGQGASVNEDTGLSAGLTIAHEMGHTMTLLHDDTYGCDPGYVMSAFAGADPNNFLWTSCSSINLKTFLSGAGADCMDNIPPFIPPLSAFVLPGAMYDLTEQCKLFLGDDAFGCPVDGVVDCSVLRCDTGGSGCSPDGLRVTAEGTPCDVDMICLAGSCIDSTSVPQRVDGNWGDWSEYSPCSRTCDCGVTTRERMCDNPSPVYSGEFCEGENSEITTCDTEVSCGNTPDDHRNEQCAASNDIEYEGQTYDWVNNIGSGLDESLFCVNLCQATGLDFGLSRSPFVNEDGTDCWNLDRLDWDRIFKCFSGSCRAFGCDGVEGSSIGYDACRICNGDESSCTRVADTYNAGNLNEFNPVATIPAGATSVYINNEDLAIGNHVGIVGEISDFEYFGGFGPTPSTNERAWRGTMTIVHEFNANLETFFTPGPTTEGLKIEYYRSGPGELEYEYYTQNAGVSYFWYLGEFSDCSVSCGAGTVYRAVGCYKVGVQRELPHSDCLTNGLDPSPPTQEECNLGDCPPEWVAGSFGDCSEECGGGTQTRTVTCKLDGQITDGAACLGEKPELQQACNEPPCEGEECHESVRSTSGRIRRTADTAGEICVITLIADLGSGFQFSNQGSSLTGSDFFKIINRGAMSQSFKGVASSTANNVFQVEYRLSGTGSFQFSYSVTVVMPPAECDEFVDATGVAGTITGEFTSPGFRKNDKYGPNLRCWQRLLVDTDRLVTLQFNRFRLQTGRHGKNRSCQYDHLEVRNLVTGETVKLCGTKRPFCLNVDYDTVLYFKTNWRRGFKGYLVKYTTT